jgi:hypothetical protein
MAVHGNAAVVTFTASWADRNSNQNLGTVSCGFFANIGEGGKSQSHIYGSWCDLFAAVWSDVNGSRSLS